MSPFNEHDEGPWRELAQAHLPDFGDMVVASTSHVDLWQMLKEFLAARGTHASSRAAAQTIFDYAWWCVAHSGNDYMVSAAETFFYEDLTVYSDLVVLVPIFLAPWQIERLETTLTYRLTAEEYDVFRAKYGEAIRRSG